MFAVEFVFVLDLVFIIAILLMLSYVVVGSASAEPFVSGESAMEGIAI